MSRFYYAEYAINSPSNRGHFNRSNHVVSLPFKKENRFKEYWRSMFLYENETPTEDNAMFGNFYIESDELDFRKNQNLMLDISHYLHRQFGIPYYFMEYFMTNRSLWLMIPAKVFACYGTIKLNQIYKTMAIEIQEAMMQKGHTKGIDLSIYKWNGLIHSLGSYLPKIKQWVTKFSFFDLEDATTAEQLRKVKFDNGVSFSDLSVVEKAKKWFASMKNKVLYQEEPVFEPVEALSTNRPCMEALAKKGYMDDNRNLHIYSYALYLKEKGYDCVEAIDHIQETFTDPYVQLRECVRTIQSAFKGNKQFSCAAVQHFLDPDLALCEEETCTKLTTKTTFIIPREFITLLHKNKMHYNGYKHLILTLYHQQIHRSDYILNIEKEKHKKDILSIFEKLSALGLIRYTLRNNKIIAKIVRKERKVYKSHILLPISFVETGFFKTSKKEFKVYMELLRMSVYTKKRRFFRCHAATLVKNLSSTSKSVQKALYALRKAKMVCRHVIFTQVNEKAFKTVVRSIVKRTISTPSLIIKCIYSRKSKIAKRVVNTGFSQPSDIKKVGELFSPIIQV